MRVFQFAIIFMVISVGLALLKKPKTRVPPILTKPQRFPVHRITKAYFFVTQHKANWFSAREYCNKINMHLASPKTISEYNTLIRVINRHPMANSVDRWWLGGNSHANTGVFVWSDGSRMQFSNWEPTQPDHKDEKCVEMRYKDMKWNNLECHTPLNFICESLPECSPQLSLRKCCSNQINVSC